MTTLKLATANANANSAHCELSSPPRLASFIPNATPTAFRLLPELSQGVLLSASQAASDARAELHLSEEGYDSFNLWLLQHAADWEHDGSGEAFEALWLKWLELNNLA